MKLFFSPTSPFVRKVRVSAFELGLDQELELLACAAHPVNRDMNIVAHNPLGKIPTLLTDDGMAIYDSRVICEYLHGLVKGSTLFPADRTAAIVDQALADGMMDAALLGRTESNLRPEPYRWDKWIEVQVAKVASALDRFEQGAGGFDGRVDIGTISIGCALSYLDLRYGHIDWRTSRPALAGWYEAFSQRPSFQATRLG